MTAQTRDYYRQAVESAGLRPGTDLEDVVAITLKRCGLAQHAMAQQYRALGYRLDFAWPRAKVALEVDGPTHYSPTGAAKDALRDLELRADGWLVFHVDGELGNDALRAQVMRAADAIIPLLLAL